jgi:hypothetical protein
MRAEEQSMTRLGRHALLPLLPSAALVTLYFTPLGVIDCVSRGLLALAIALTSLLAALITAAVAIKMRIRGENGSEWWILTTVVLVLPALLLLGPLG